MGFRKLDISYEGEVDDSSQFLNGMLVQLIKQDKEYKKEIRRDGRLNVGDKFLDFWTKRRLEKFHSHKAWFE